MGLTRERLGSSIDRIHHGLLHINTNNLMTHASELDCQRQPDLPERNNGDPHEHFLPKHVTRLTASLPRMILPIVFQEPQMDREARRFSASVPGQRSR